jgi:hypothetical protein
MEQNKRRSYGQFGVGFFLLAVGVALLLDKFDIFYIGSVWHYWPILIIASGFGRLLDAQEAWEYRKSVWWLFIGSWLLISELHLFGLSYHNSWPILLIGAGIGMLWKSAYPSHFKFVKDHCHGN